MDWNALSLSLCGLLYVGETKGQLNKRMNGHRSEINQPNHFVLSLKVRTLEKKILPYL